MPEPDLFYRVLGALGRSTTGERGLVEIPEEFESDNCTWWFDSLFGYDFTDLCRVHDWSVCTRAQPEGSMSHEAMEAAASVLSQHMTDRLPWWLDFTAGAVYRVLYMSNSWYYDTCGIDVGDRCRHNMPRPIWM